MSLTLKERRKRVDIALQDVFERINLVNKDLGDSFNDVVERELLNEPRFTEEGLVEELEAFHDYVLDKLEYHDDERLYVPKSRGRRVAGGFEPVFVPPKTVEDVVAKVENANIEAPVAPAPEAVEIKVEPSAPKPTNLAAALPELDVVEAAPATKAVDAVESKPEVEEDEAEAPVDAAKTDLPKITAEDILAKEFTENSKGYSADAVDDVLDDIAAFFRKENPSRLEIKQKAKEIRDVIIPKSRVFQKGPDDNEVDDYLDLLIAVLESRV